MYNAANNASSQLAQAISAADTSLTVLDGSSFPDAPFVVSIEDEIIEVGAKSGNTFSALVRGAEGTTPASHVSGVRVENRFTAGAYTAMTDMLDELAGVHIVERGSNANGEYVKWENGLMVCWHRWVQEPLEGSAYYTRQGSAVWTFPAAFVNIPAIIPSGEPRYWSGPWQDTTHPNADYGGIAITPHGTEPTTTLSVQIKYFYHIYSGHVIINTIAIGRWK